MRKTTHVEIRYKDGSTYNIRRGYINPTTYEMAKKSGYYVIEKWEHMDRVYGEESIHTYIKVETSLVDYIEVTELNGSKTIYGEMFDDKIFY